MQDDELLQIGNVDRKDFWGTLVRWFKCLFMDCNAEDAERDRQIAAQKRREEEEKQAEERRKAEEEAAAKRPA
jgi:hypothetical protein